MKKIGSILLCLLLILTLPACSNKKTATSTPTNRQEPTSEVQEAFDQLLLDIYKEEVGSDALSLHYSLKDPSTFGIELDGISLGSITEEESAKQDQKVLDWLTKLSSFDTKELNSSQLDDYRVVKAYLEIQKNFIGLDYYGHLFTPASSYTSNLITNFVEYRFFEKEDIDTYLILLEDVARFLDEALVYTQKQVDMGLFMPDYAVDGTVEEIDKFIVKVSDNELILSFNDKLEAFELDDATKNTLRTKNEELVKTIVLPSYTKVKDSLVSWKGSATGSGSYADTATGKQYYEALMRYKIGYQGNIDDLFKTGCEQLKSIMSNMVSLMYKDEKLFDRYVDSGSSFAQKEPSEILKDYEKSLLKAFPQGPQVNYTAEYLDPSIANASTIAYYLIPPLDDISDNVIKINPGQTDGDLLTLYTTLAHEGFPGHCYQNTYYYSTNPHPIRTVYDFLGYGEGWANMIEMDALGWLLPKDENLAQFLALDIYYPYLLQGMIDIGVNYYNWDQAELKTWLSEYGIIYGLDNDESVTAMYEAVTSDPGILLPYGVGMMEMVLLKEKTQEALGKKYNDVEYHRVILEAGPMTFDLLEEKVNQYIDSKK